MSFPVHSFAYLEVGQRRKIHRAARINGSAARAVVLTSEGCNLDIAGNRREVTPDEARVLILAYPLRRCRRCIQEVPHAEA